MILSSQQGLGLLHCAAENNQVEVMHFVFESIEGLNVNETEKVSRPV